MATGILSRGITLSYATTASGTYTAIPDLQEIPDLGGDVDTVETTTLADSAKRYIQGIKDYGDLEFNFLYDNSESTSNYRVLRGLEEAGNIVYWKVAFPDTTTFSFSGSVITAIDGAGVGDALTFKATITLNSDITVTNPSA